MKYPFALLFRTDHLPLDRNSLFSVKYHEYVVHGVISSYSLCTDKTYPGGWNPSSATKLTRSVLKERVPKIISPPIAFVKPVEVKVPSVYHFTMRLDSKRLDRIHKYTFKRYIAIRSGASNTRLPYLTLYVADGCRRSITSAISLSHALV